MMDIFREMKQMQDEMDKIFENFYSSKPLMIRNEKNLPAIKEGFRMPICDMYETENSIIASIELPGVDKKDIDLYITDKGIEIKVEKKDEKENKTKEIYQYESYGQSFYRRIPFPAEADSSKANASFNNGILRIEVNKKNSEAQKKNKISIK